MAFPEAVITQTKSNLIQYTEYHPFQQTTANSWTREQMTGNNFLANGGTELNPTTQLYDLDFRNYDPLLGRMNGVDPMAAKYTSLTPYNYSFNNPLTFNDPSGADPPQTVNYSATYNQYYTMYTYDDRIDYHWTEAWVDRQGWRLESAERRAFYASASGYGTGGMGAGWKPGDGRLFWSRSEIHHRQMIEDARLVKNGEMSYERYHAKYGYTFTVPQFKPKGIEELRPTIRKEDLIASSSHSTYQSNVKHSKQTVSKIPEPIRKMFWQSIAPVAVGQFVVEGRLPRNVENFKAKHARPLTEFLCRAEMPE